MILTKVLLRNLEFKIGVYIVRQIPKDTEGYTGIVTDLKETILEYDIYYSFILELLCLNKDRIGICLSLNWFKIIFVNV